MAQICNQNPKTQLCSRAQIGGPPRVGGMFQIWGRGKSYPLLLGPKGVLDNFFVRQVVMLKQEAGPKAT